MSTWQNPEAPRALDDETIEQLIAQGSTTAEPDSLAWLCGRLVTVAPRAEASVARRLEEQTLAHWDSIQQTRLATLPKEVTPPTSVQRRPARLTIALGQAKPRHRVGLAALLAAAVIVLAIIAPLIAERDQLITPRLLDPAQIDALVRSASAATPPIPSQQVLHCTITSGGTPGYVYDIWLDPQRRLARAETHLQGQLIGRSVFDGAEFSSYSPSRGWLRPVAYTYEQAVGSFPTCSLADQLEELRRQLRPEWPVTATEEEQAGIPVIVLRFRMDADVDPKKVIVGARAEPGHTLKDLPAEYIFTRDGHRLIAVQTWAIAGAEPQGPTWLNYRISYALEPDAQYPASFFSPSTTNQP